jgi:vancomycin resistance protein YoaR
VNNIALAAKKIDGVILNPGEEFSYNGTVGQRTESAGFKKAGAYANGKVVQELGGGICQVSSTLYCAVLYANLEITDRTCHYFPVDYLPSGLDATVSWKSPDFKFKNNRDYPIKLVRQMRHLQEDPDGGDLGHQCGRQLCGDEVLHLEVLRFQISHRGAGR